MAKIGPEALAPPSFASPIPPFHHHPHQYHFAPIILTEIGNSFRPPIILTAMILTKLRVEVSHRFPSLYFSAPIFLTKSRPLSRSSPATLPPRISSAKSVLPVALAPVAKTPHSRLLPRR
jgi:hypothetical protein